MTFLVFKMAEMISRCDRGALALKMRSIDRAPSKRLVSFSDRRGVAEHMQISTQVILNKLCIFNKTDLTSNKPSKPNVASAVFKIFDLKLQAAQLRDAQQVPETVNKIHN